MIIDSHAHLVPVSLIEEVRSRENNFPSVQQFFGEPGLAFAFAGSKPTRPVPRSLMDIPGRLKWMDEQTIDLQVCGGWVDMFGNELPADEGARWAQMLNKHLMAQHRAEPRIIPLACLPLQDGGVAAEVLREAAAQGFKGAMIGTRPGGLSGMLDDQSLDPFWREADALKFTIFVHPVFESGDDRVHDFGMANTVGRVTDMLLTLSRLIYSGHIVRYAGVKFIVGIGGAALPYVIGRLRRNYMLDKERLSDPDAALAAMYYDTIVQDARTLRYLADMVGTGRLLMGSDMPFPIGDCVPMQLIEAAGFAPAEMNSIAGGLAAQLFA